MSAGQRREAARRWQAPHEDGAALVDPPFSEVGPLLERNAALRARSGAEIAGRPLTELAAEARAELVQAARAHTAQYRAVPAPAAADRMLLAGHQPEMFHPGVWFKNFALSALGRRHGATAINLVIDGDAARPPSVRVPGGSTAAPVVRSIEFDAPAPEAPYEERAIVDFSVMESFGVRAAGHLAPLVPQPLLAHYWPLVVERGRATGRLGRAISEGRHRLEAELGWETLELPQSRMCELPAFAWYAAHLLLELPRLHAEYNAAVAEYRRVHHVRSASHPVPDLASDGAWLEAPLWVWDAGSPRRRRLFARRMGDCLELTDRGAVRLCLPAAGTGGAERTVAALSALAVQGVKLRTRALATTLWARLALGDLFLHGIGGAKYDAVTDRIVERFFGVMPPAFLTLSATLHLPVARGLEVADELPRVERELRDLDYQPERWLEAAQTAADSAGEPYRTIAVKRAHIAEASTPESARGRARAIRSANAVLAPWVAPRRAELEARRAALTARAGAEAVLRSREYAFCLFPEEKMRDFLLAVWPAGA
jgi:hypothetical protein